jgi:membrane fusion protein (multidrug efflux system)
MIGTGKTWIEANFKETQLADVRVGQPVSIRVDTYPGLELRGTVESISPGSGSEFSILPAQNATGNWVKIVQRVAVRISIDNPPENLALRAGMSGAVTIDTGSYPHLPWGKKAAG